MSLEILLLGGIVVMLAALLGGATGFGYGLASAPLLLLLGFPLKFVVTVNLVLALVTRISVAYRFRSHLRPRFFLMLIAGSVPGVLLGAKILTSVNVSLIKLAIGLIVMVLVVLLIRTSKGPTPEPIPGAPVSAGFVGGFLGITTSLNGVPVALLLARDRASASFFQANLAVYFVVSNTIALGVLAAAHALVIQALFPIGVLWLPGSLLGNLVGAILSTRMPEAVFRRLTLTVAFVAGAMTVLRA